MCIIIVVPKGEKLPDKDIFKNCFSNNKDGIGYMYRTKNKVRIKKGFFNLDEFYNSVNNVKDSEIVIHFRYATHGNISSGNCHPFPLTKDVKELTQTKIDTQIGIVHNGIIAGAKITKGDKLSDTMVFIKTLDIDNIKDISQKVTVSDGKFIIMTRYKTFMIGDFIFDEGIYYSNHSYQYDIGSFGFEDETLPELCSYCKRQYLDESISIADDPCLLCTGRDNFVLSSVPEDIDNYYQDFEELYDADDIQFNLGTTYNKKYEEWLLS